MTRPYETGKTDYSMHMVGHHHKCIQERIRKMRWYSLPAFANNLATFIQQPFSIFNFTEKASLVIGANGNKISAALCIIISRQADGTAMVGVGIKRHIA